MLLFLFLYRIGIVIKMGQFIVYNDFIDTNIHEISPTRIPSWQSF